MPYAADCILALLGEEADDVDARQIGAQLVAEALLALVGFRLPDEER